MESVEAGYELVVRVQ